MISVGSTNEHNPYNIFHPISVSIFCNPVRERIPNDLIDSVINWIRLEELLHTPSVHNCFHRF